LTKGRAIANLLPRLAEGEYVTATLPVRKFDTEHFLIFAASDGMIKRTRLSEFGRPRAAGVRALTLCEGSELIGVKLSDGTKDVILATAKGKAIRFNENELRAMGRSARGVRGIRLVEGDCVVSLSSVVPDSTLLSVTANGYGKRTFISQYRKTRRGGKGIVVMARTPKTGDVVGVLEVSAGDELLITTEQGMVIRLSVKDVPIQGRATQGVRMITLKGEDKVSAVARIIVE
jgi:DNA gyrase subunit A